MAKGNRSFALIAFTGEQPPGNQVAEIRNGWEVQGGDQFALVLARKGDPDSSIDPFQGKLVVMLQSRDASAPAWGQSDPVIGHTGFLDVRGRYSDADLRARRWPLGRHPGAYALGWDGAKLA